MEEKEYRKRLEARLVRNMMRTGRFLQGRVVSNISRGQPRVRTPSGWRGLEPSKPGEFPKTLSGDLKRSIDSRVERIPGVRVSLFVVGQTPYALTLERTDALNRPYLKPTLQQNRARVRQMMFR